VIDEIGANLRALEIDEIKERLEPLIKGMQIESPIFDPGALLYRGRRIGPTFTKQAGIKLSDLLYPPKHLARLGRLNRNEQPVFYCSMHKESVFFEVQGLQTGDEVILTFWKTKERMIVNNIGYTEFVFQQLGAKRAVPRWNSHAPPLGSDRETIALPEMSKETIDVALSQDKMRDVREALSQHFMHTVGPTETDSYKLTTAIGELHLGTIVDLNEQFAGVLYPSVRMWGNGDNLALLPWFVDRHVEFRKAVHVRIDDRADTNFSVTYLDSAREFDVDGKLIWLGRLPNWTLQKPFQKAKFTFTLGPDEDGDYQISRDGHPCHWIAVDIDTGDPIAAL
jgi:RES domain